MKKRILFVDDDPQLLTSIKRMLWNVQDKWELRFTTSTAEALEILQGTHLDVIVADMRMPGTDGRKLLRTVRKHYPWIMRIILSGDSDRGHIMRSVPEAHQFLTKPVTADQLLGTIERGLALRDMIVSDEHRAIIGRIDSLPTQPEIYKKLLEVLEDESAPVEAISGIIIRDAALTADILKLVNSSFFGPRMQVRGLDQAVNLLGVETIKGLVLGVKMLRVFDTRKIPNFSFPTLWEHCLNTARIARRIAADEELSAEEQDDSFISGMLHDLGKFILADKLTETYRGIVDTARKENSSLSGVEAALLGTSHAQTGAYLLGLWGMPDRVLEAVVSHHSPSTLGRAGMSVLAAVHVANALEHTLVVINPDYVKHEVDLAFLEQAGLSHRLDAWTQTARQVLAGEEDE